MAAPSPEHPHDPACVVLDTNIVLDLWVFADAQAQRVKEAVQTGRLQWLATEAMREELTRVLDYPQIARRLHQAQCRAADVLDTFGRHARIVTAPPKAAFTCKDVDDQKFVDLAAAHRCLLLSKDHAVLCMARRLQTLGVATQACWAGP